MDWTRNVISLFYFFWQWALALFNKNKCRYGGHKRPDECNADTFPRHSPKPEWVRKEVIRLKALMPNDGHRKIAFAFNRLHADKRNMTVGKTFVGYTIKNQLYEIQILRKKLKHKRPKPVTHNLIWAIAFTGKTNKTGKHHPVLGVVEHHSRACLTLSALADKSTLTLLRFLLDLIEQYQKPKIIRTDNEAVFTSPLFWFCLWLLRIKHQRTEVACPWMNGRIERLFGTLKEKLNQWEVDSYESLNHSLHIFLFWYNHVRPHQHLDGLTPAEVWQGKTNFIRRNNKAYWFDEWEGLLRGYYLPP